MHHGQSGTSLPGALDDSGRSLGHDALSENIPSDGALNTTVQLVRPYSLSSQGLPFTITTPDISASPYRRTLSSVLLDREEHLHSPSHDGSLSLDDEHFSPVQLTPRLEAPTRASSSSGSTSSGSTSVSQASTLIYAGSHPGILTRIQTGLLTLSKGSSAVSSAATSPTIASLAGSSRPSSVRSGSSSSKTSLQSSIAAVDKFTQKWPRPRSLRQPPPSLRSGLGSFVGTARYGGWSESEMKAALMEGKGLGANWRGRWTLHKWCLLVSVTSVFFCGLGGILCSLLTWFAAYPVAPMLLATDSPALILLTLTSSLFLLSSVIGITGTLLNSRPILAVYALLLFPTFFSLASIGYITYKKAHFALDRKLSEAWSDWYTPGVRLVVQSALHCCGWPNPLHGATPSGTCYPRSPLPGCRNPLLDFERTVLPMIYGTAFSLVPLHIANIVVALLCTNHVTARFGKGIMPRRYRLHAADVASIGADWAGGQDRGVLSMGVSGVPQAARATATGLGLFREDRQDSRRRVSIGIRR